MSDHSVVPSIVRFLYSEAAAQMGRRLSSLADFLEAAQELLRCRSLSPEQFVHYSKKIITLLEIARDTLLRVGIKLQQFVSCPPNLQPYKAAYYELLKMLQSRRELIEGVTPRRRVARLLFPLTSSFILSPTASHLISRPSASAPPLACSCAPVTEQRNSASSSEPNELSSIMPPPDAFPLRPKRRTTRITLDADTDADAGVQKRPSSPLYDCIVEERECNSADDGYRLSIRPPLLRRKFGILFTGKTKGCGPSGVHRSGRSSYKSIRIS